MSFSSEVKEEISKITNLANKQSVKFIFHFAYFYNLDFK